MEQPAGAAPQRWRLLIAYDGAAFRGFAVQPEVPTVAGALRQALERTARLSEPPLIACAGSHRRRRARPWTGRPRRPARHPLRRAGPGPGLNRQLAPEVVVRRAEPVGPDFDARRSATGRAYRYLIWNAPEPDPLLDPIAWHVSDPLDLGSMRTASDVLLGSHDFRSFCRRRPGSDVVVADRPPGDEGPLGRRRGTRGHRRRGRHRGGPAAPLRRRRQLLLPPDGPFPGVQPRRGGPGPGERGGPHGAPAGGQPAPDGGSGAGPGLCLVSVAYDGRSGDSDRRPATKGSPRTAEPLRRGQAERSASAGLSRAARQAG